MDVNPNVLEETSVNLEPVKVTAIGDSCIFLLSKELPKIRVESSVHSDNKVDNAIVLTSGKPFQIVLG